MNSSPLLELVSITTADGNTLNFDRRVWAALSYGGFGAAPTEFQTRRGYKQDGVTETGLLLQPRTIALRLYQPNTCTRAAYWDARMALLEYLRPNRDGALTFTLLKPDGQKRAITARLTAGAEFAPDPPTEAGWDIDETLELTAFNPTWIDPEQQTTSPAGNTGTSLVFPITFPITFGPAGTIFTASIAYVGTWQTYPTLLLTAPYLSVVIEHVELGVAIGLSVPQVAGVTRLITLDPSLLAVTDGNGNGNYFGELLPDSNLVDFAIRPNPQVAGGTNTIRATFIGGGVGSAFTVRWYNRYYGI